MDNDSLGRMDWDSEGGVIALHVREQEQGNSWSSAWGGMMNQIRQHESG